ncbi:SRPBCC family protein [Streptomyces sp. NBC_00687]|uniref:SRPBCC family protein n=1 Tax=Streptomyces sp. NBC_00687 TaxID=2975807 RepID=UPI00224F2EB6|nr:SRPBCC family protein [Streptomyces sp. NBC_00687]MCX4919049.1 SRPBCC family protein [Streptomyces sp. NBC_00687]
MSAITTVTERAVLAVPLERIWHVVSATDRYAEWVDGVLEVTAHHGTAEVGRTYRERNRTVGPLTTRSTWTVRVVDPLRRRVDTATGFEPLRDLANIFEFRRLTFEDGTEGAEMTYTVRYRPGLGVLGRAIDRMQQPVLRKAFQTSMRNLEDLVVAEGNPAPASFT